MNTATATAAPKRTTLQKRLEEARKEKGVSVSEARAAIQRLTGLSRATMTHWWNGKAKEPRGAAALKAANYLGVQPLWLATGTGPKRAEKGTRTMPLPPGVDLDSDDIAAILRVAKLLNERALAHWLQQGMAIAELTKKPSRTNPFGKGNGGRKRPTPAGSKKRRV